MSHMILLCFEGAVVSLIFSQVQRPEKAILNCSSMLVLGFDVQYSSVVKQAQESNY